VEGSSFSACETWFASEYLIDPILVSSGVSGARQNVPMRAYIAGHLRIRLGQIAGVTVRDTGDVKSGIVTFTLNGCESKEVERLLAMQPRHINVATSTFRSTMLDMQSRGLRDVVRTSVHAYNTEQDIEVVAQTIETAMVSKLAKAAR
jgi:selenocysteine lyase/cysteine desulfurase